MLRAQALAKINRELRVGSRRPDGFHELFSRVVSIDLSDVIKAEPAEGLLVTVSGAPIPADENNLVVKAARLLASHLSIPPRARIHLRKKIPAGAGLGGASADAAVTLRLLARLWQATLAPGELSQLAAQLGSDVPFFLVGGEADMRGRGELVIPREDGPSSELLLLVPPFSLPTAEVYASHDRVSDPSLRALPEQLEIETSGRFFGPNDLALTVLRTHSEMGVYLRSAAEITQDHAMTGSGSVIALAGASRGSAETLARRHPEARVLACRTVGREEYSRLTHPSGGA